MTRELLQRVLTALEYHQLQTRPIHNTELVIEAIRAEIAKPSQQERKPMMYERKKELVSNWFAEDWAQENALEMLDDYDTMAQQERKPMTEDEKLLLWLRTELYGSGQLDCFIAGASAAEAFHGIKETP